MVVEQSGTTRDRVESFIHIEGRAVKIVDTGGYLAGEKDEIALAVKDQIRRAMEEASVILLVTDATEGISGADEEVAKLLRKFSKSVIVVVNKADNDKLALEAVEFYKLGFGDPEAVSCLHRRGISALKKRIKESLESIREVSAAESVRRLKIAVVGRPNVGKSSFVNNLLTYNRVIVSEIPGTTRDSIDTHFSYEGDEYILIDTAGIRHKRKIKKAVDSYSVIRSEESIKRADVVVLLIDAPGGLTRDDLGILNFIQESGKACLVAINKWDLAEEVSDVSMDEYKKHLLYASNELNKFPILFVSAKTGMNVLDSLPVIKVLDANLDVRCSTPFLNKIFEVNDPALISIPKNKKRPNFLYIIQSRVRPVEFKFFVNDPESVLAVHLKFIENQLRENLSLVGIPIKIEIRKSRKRGK